jgi:hypothetical protein
MFAVARLNTGAVLESNFSFASLPEVETLPGEIVEVRCRCPRELALARYRGRLGRHPGHLDRHRSDDELWNDELLRPLGIGPVLEVDTSADVDVAALVRAIGEGSRGRVTYAHRR